MSYVQGNCGRSARHYGDELQFLYGRLTMELDAVYPEDSCLECLKEGKTKADEKCFHRHWGDDREWPRSSSSQ